VVYAPPAHLTPVPGKIARPRSPVTPGELGALSAKGIDSPSMVRNYIRDVSGRVVTA
jgi:hypothetical protein